MAITRGTVQHVSKPPVPFFPLWHFRSLFVCFLFPGQASQLLVHVLLLKHEHSDYQHYLVFQIINRTIAKVTHPGDIIRAVQTVAFFFWRLATIAGTLLSPSGLEWNTEFQAARVY